MSAKQRNIHNHSNPHPAWNDSLANSIRNRGESESAANHAAHNRKIASLDQKPVEKGGRGK